MKILPKQIVPYVRVTVAKVAGEFAPDAVLIDDDPLVRRAWQVAASEAGKNLHAFPSPASFIRAIGRYEGNVPLYIDSHLAGNEKGEVFAEHLSAWGFSEICLVTGADQKKFLNLPFLKKVRGKSPPFRNRSAE